MRERSIDLSFYMEVLDCHLPFVCFSATGNFVPD